MILRHGHSNGCFDLLNRICESLLVHFINQLEHKKKIQDNRQSVYKQISCHIFFLTLFD